MNRRQDFEVRKALANFAQNSQLFALLDAPGIQRFAAIAVIEDLPAGHRIVTQGEVGTSFYLIANGEVRILVDAGGGETKEVARLGSGNFFGEIAVLTRQPRTATVECTEPSTLLHFDREPVIEILADYPKVKEVIGGVGLLRSEANLEDVLGTGGGLADALEAEEELADESFADGDEDDEEEEAPEMDLDDLLAAPEEESVTEPPAPPTDGAGLAESDLFADDDEEP